VQKGIALTGFDPTYVEFNEHNGMTGFQNAEDRLLQATGKNNGDSLNERQYRELKLEALNLTPETNAGWKYEIIAYTYKSTRGAEFRNILYTASKDGVTITLAYPILHFMNYPISVVAHQWAMIPTVKSIYENLMGGFSPDFSDNNASKRFELTDQQAKKIFNFKHLSPGRIVRTEPGLQENFSGQVIDRLEEKNPGLKISRSIFVSTQVFIKKNGIEIPNPFKGDAFILYTYNQSNNQLNPTHIKEITMNGLMINGNDNFPEKFAGGIGMIRLDNKKHNFSSLFDIVNDPSFAKLEFMENVNTVDNQLKMAGFLSGLILGLEVEVTNTGNNVEVINTFYEQSKLLNAGMPVLSADYVKQAIDSRDGKHNLEAIQILRNILKKNTENLGSQKVDETNAPLTGTNKNKKSYPLINKGTYSFLKLVPGDGENMEPNALVDIDKMLLEIKKSTNGKPETLQAVLSILDDFLKISGDDTLKNTGIYARPRIVSSPKNKNKSFAILPISNVPYYTHSVAAIEVPQLRVDREELVNAMSNPPEEFVVNKNNDNESDFEELKEEINQLVSIKKVDYDKYIQSIADLLINDEGKKQELRDLLDTKFQKVKGKTKKTKQPRTAKTRTDSPVTPESNVNQNSNTMTVEELLAEASFIESGNDFQKKERLAKALSSERDFMEVGTDKSLANLIQLYHNSPNDPFEQMSIKNEIEKKLFPVIPEVEPIAEVSEELVAEIASIDLNNPDLEKINDISDALSGETKIIFDGSLEPNLSDEFLPEAEEIVNSPLNPYKNLLNLSSLSAGEANTLVEKWDKNSPLIRENLNKVSDLVVDKAKLKNASDTFDQIQANVDDYKSELTRLAAEQEINSTVASMDNLFPEKQKNKFSEDDKEIIESLDGDLKKIYIKWYNGEKPTFGSMKIFRQNAMLDGKELSEEAFGIIGSTNKFCY